MLKILTYISRLLIGVTFIISGFVKLVDPDGTKIKMTEYFMVNFFDKEFLTLDFLIPAALPISLLLILAELILGVMLLVGLKPKVTVLSIFALNMVFLFLTWYSYTYDVVTDCGCFGDAIKLTTGETFYKNVINTFLLVILYFGIRYIKPILNDRVGLTATFATFGVSSIIAFYSLNHLPVLDFRAYKEGTNIRTAMKIQEGDEFPKIEDLGIETEEGNQLEKVLEAEKVMLIVVHDLKKLDKSVESIENIKSLCLKAKANGYLTYVLTDTPPQYADEGDIPETLKEFNFAACDVKTMKTAIRATPGVITIKKAVITGKWNIDDADDVQF